MATQAELNEARTAYHQLQTGQATRVFVDQNGERVEFIGARSTDLLSYIRELERALGICPAQTPRPIRFLF